MADYVISVDDTGAVSMVYADDFDLPGFTRSIDRLSSVEPDADGLWYVHFLHEPEPRPPRFVSRGDALKYEVEEANKMLKKGEL